MEDDRADRMIAAARACLGTRFRHQGRSPKAGLDCLGLIVHAARASGLRVQDDAHYSRQPRPQDLRAYVDANRMVVCSQPSPGTIGVFDFGAGPQHVALFTHSGMIHAYAPARKVVEHGLRVPWTSQLSIILAFPSQRD